MAFLQRACQYWSLDFHMSTTNSHRKKNVVKGDAMNLTFIYDNVTFFHPGFCLCYPGFMFKTSTCHVQRPS